MNSMAAAATPLNPGAAAPAAAPPARDDAANIFYLPQGDEAELFEQAARQQLPLMIKGPTGCGKTRLVQYMAARLGRPLRTVSCHDDLTASDLVGRHLIGNEGTFWCDGPLTRAVREGAVCYLDEVVEARRDTTVVIHPLTDERRMLPLEKTGEVLQAPPEFMLVISYNPGYQNLLKGLKPSTRQRFVGLTLGFPPAAAEREILQRETGIDQDTAALLVDLAAALRNLQGYDLEEGASTRLLVYAAHLLGAGSNLERACRAALIEPLTDDEETQQALAQIIHARLP